MCKTKQAANAMTQRGKSFRRLFTVFSHLSVLILQSVAELAEMPLYSVACGDIGTKPEVVENYLETVLMVGKRWNCGK